MIDPAILGTLRRWRDDPVAFVSEALHVEEVEPWQVKALREIAGYDRVSIKSGHGVGKSAFLAWVVLWWLATRFPSKVACTAPTSHQLEDVLWGELASWHRRMDEPLRRELDLKALRLSLMSAPSESFAVGRTARRDQPEAFQGFHSENMLFIGDEASGIDDIIFEVGEGAMSTAGAKTLLTGNPTRRQGYFFETFHKARGFWRTMTVRCQDSSRATAEFVEKMAEEHGVDSDRYRVRVLGEFPRASTTQFIGMDLIDHCRGYVAQGYEHAPRILGVDIARFGDDQTVLCRRQGRKVHPFKKRRGLDTMAVADLIVEDIIEWKPHAVAVDGGGVGGGVVDRLKQLGYAAIVHEINFGGRAMNPIDYANRRAEMWGLAKAAMRDGVELPPDQELLDDLTGPDYGFTNKQQVILEKKEDMKKRGLASPDCGDAYALTYTVRPLPEPVATVEEGDWANGSVGDGLGWMAS